MAPEFIEAMLEIIPYVHEHKGREVTMKKLCDATGLEIEKFYGIVSANLYKNPYILDRIIRLRRAADMLRTDSKSVEQIALDCGFASPNFFIANFYHQYKMTPADYRKTS